jgi:hypothetical protein
MAASRLHYGQLYKRKARMKCKRPRGPKGHLAAVLWWSRGLNGHERSFREYLTLP